MSNKSDLLKTIVKGTFTTEDAALDRYLLSRGINPKFATKDQKVAHSKTGQFIKWKRDHMLEGISMVHTPTQQRLQALKKSQHVNKEIRVADGHKQLHPQNEAVDKKDTVTLDIPLLIRVLELAREDIKSDMDLHRVVEKLINIRNKGMLTMKDYNYIAKIHEEVMPQITEEQLDEVAKWRNTSVAKKVTDPDSEDSKSYDYHHDYPRSTGMKKATSDTEPKYHSLSTRPKAQVATTGIRKGMITKQHGERLKARIKSSLSNEETEQIDEISKELTHSYFKKAYAQKYENKPSKPTKLQMKNRNKGMAAAHKRLVNRLELPKGTDPSEGGKYTADSVEHDGTPMVEAQSAAVRWQKALENAKKKREEEEKRNTENAKRALTPKPVQEADCGCDVPPEDKNKKLIQMSKSARIIKSIYKKKGVSEEMYDHEKDDKSVSSYGKKPKISTTNQKQNVGENKPDAAAVLKGGTTLTVNQGILLRLIL